jgi:hypothetical protein
VNGYFISSNKTGCVLDAVRPPENSYARGINQFEWTDGDNVVRDFSEGGTPETHH